MNINFLIKVFLVLLLLAPCACSQPEQKKVSVSPFLQVGERQLSRHQFEQALQATYPDILLLTGAEQLQLKEQLLKQVIDRELILGEASRLNVQLTPDEFDAAMLEVRGNYTQAEFAKVLEQMDASPENWFSALKLRLLTAKVSDAAIKEQVHISEKEIEAYYRENRESFRRPVEIRARQMLFKTRAKAQTVLELLNAGGSFALLAKQYSQSPDREQGGLLGYFSAGKLPAVFDAVLFKLPVKQVSRVIESPYGFHLFFVERKRGAGIRQYAVVKDEIIEKLLQQKEEVAFHAWLDALQKETIITIDRAQL